MEILQGKLLTNKWERIISIISLILSLTNFTEEFFGNSRKDMVSQQVADMQIYGPFLYYLVSSTEIRFIVLLATSRIFILLLVVCKWQNKAGGYSHYNLGRDYALNCKINIIIIIIIFYRHIVDWEGLT